MRNNTEEDDELQPLISLTKKELADCNDFDDVLEVVGGEGKFQKIFLYGIMSPLIVFVPISVISTIFMFHVPEHWCHVPGRPDSYSPQAWRNATIPIVKGPDGLERFSQCSMFDPSKDQVPCTQGWDYDTTDFIQTMSSHYNWVCDKSEYPTLALAVGLIGNSVGTIAFGQLADKYGRKLMFFTALFVNIVPRLMSLFVAEYFWLFLVLQFINGTSFPATFNLPTTILAENCGKDYRGWVYAVAGMSLVAGLSLVALIAWSSAHWFYIGLAISVPGFFFFLYLPVLKESPRWLLSVGRTQESTIVLHKIATVNRNPVDPDALHSTLQKLYTQQHTQASGSTNRIGVWTLFTRARLAKNTILLCTCWCMSTTVYLAIMMGVGNLTGNQFLNFFLLSVIELPANWFGGYIVDKTGRRWTSVGFYILSAICFLTAALAASSQSLSALVITSVCIAKSTVAVTMLALNLQGTEIFPTQLRTTGTGLAATARFMVGSSSPYIASLGQENSSLPYFAMALLTVIGIVASSQLPETYQKALPETIEDADNFAKDDKFWSYLPECGAGQSRLRQLTVSTDDEI